LIKARYLLLLVGFPLIGIGLASSLLLPIHLILKIISGCCALIFLSAGLAANYNRHLSRNRSWCNPRLAIESWDVVNDGHHNSNTDLVYFKGQFFLAHAVSPYHFGHTDCKIVIKSSADALTWKITAEIKPTNQDIRDPKFAVIEDRLFLYVLLNVEVDPQPFTTLYSSSLDGITWEPFQSIGQEGWLFWRPRSLDRKTWYCPAYWHQFNQSALFRSGDGRTWEKWATIHEGGVVNETCCEFFDDGMLIAAGRMEYSKELFDLIFGHPRCSTMLSAAHPPYTHFQPLVETQITRLDGPVLFKHGGRIFAVGRSQPHSDRFLMKPGAVLAKKRTSLYEVTRQGMVYLSDLPSAGDTSYAGVVLHDGYAWISYYTSDIQHDCIWFIGMHEHDCIWFIGMHEPTSIRLARIPLPNLLQAAA